MSTGSGSLSSVGTPVFLDEYTPSGTLVQSIALPAADSGTNETLVASGTATSEGLITRSADGRYILLTGYDTAPGTASVSGTASTAVNRTIGLVGTDGVVDTSLALTDFATGNNPRSAASTDGTNIWAAGGAGGVRYTANDFNADPNTSTQLNSDVVNIRQLGIFGGQLFASTSSGSSVRIGAVGTGLPTTAGQTLTPLLGIPTSGSPYGFFLTDLSPTYGYNGTALDTLYVAEDTASGGQILKYTYNGTAWAESGTATAASVRGLTASVDGSNVSLYGSTAGTLYALTDSTGYGGRLSGSAASIATAPANTAFRGIAFTPQATSAPVQPTVSVSDASIPEGDSGTSQLSFTVTRSDTSTAFNVDFATDDGTATTADGDYVPAAGSLSFTAGGPASQTVSITINGDTRIESNETLSLRLSNLANVTGSTVLGRASANGTITNDDAAALTPIYAIQGSGAASPLAGQRVTTRGVVTGIASNGFYIQDQTGDGDAATSDGVFVFTSSAPTAVVGNLVEVVGTVTEFTPTGAVAGTLSVTEITGPTVQVIDPSVALPASVRIGGAGGLTPPTEDLAAGNAFYERLEGMRVTVSAPRATGPTSSFGEIYTVASDGAGGYVATGTTPRGGVLVSGGQSSFGNTNTVGGDFNPERIQIDDGLGFATPQVNTGAVLGDLTGVVNYSFGSYEVLASQAVAVTSDTLQRQGSTLTGDADHLLVASYNAENLDPGDGAARFATVAQEITGRLNSPDIVAFQEIQDNDGATNSSVTSASQTLQQIVDAVRATNGGAGPQYAFVDNPFIGDDTNGGEPGGNIRTSYLYRTDRVGLVPNSLRTIAADGSAITDTSAAANADQRNNVNSPFYTSRPPLTADFTFNGQTITIVNNHFTSKGGSGVLFGSVQPPLDGGEVRRAAQAQAVNTFVDGLLAANPNARVLVTGDLNEYGFEEPLSVLRGTASVSNFNGSGNGSATYTPGGTAILGDLQDTLPENQRYDYVFEGNSQALDHMFATGALAAGAQFQPARINAEFYEQTSDHDPLTARFAISAPADTMAPTLVSASPADNATGVAVGVDIVLTFSETVRAGTGSIVLRPATGADVTIPVSGSQVIVSGNTVTINPSADLRPGVAYDVIVPSGAITDASGNAFAGIAQDALDFTTSSAIPGGIQATTFTIGDPGTYTLAQGTTRTQTAGAAVSATVASGTTQIDIQGTLDNAASGARGIDTDLARGSVTVGAAGTVRTLNGDAVRVRSVNGRTDLTNLGQIIAGTAAFTPAPGGSAPATAFAVTYNAARGASGAPATDYESGGVITNGSAQNTTALIRSDTGDAIRLGSHQTLVNYGQIVGNGPVNDSSANNGLNSTGPGGNGNPNTSTLETYDNSRGVRLNQSGATAVIIENHNRIEGAQHGVDVGQANVTGLVVDNRAGATILGRNGSGVGADTTGTAANTVTVNNAGIIRGEYAPRYDRAGYVTVDGDADGVDVDGAATVNNFAGGVIAGSGADGNLTGQGAGGFDSSGRANASEGLSLGGGIVNNAGLISGANTGIVVNNDSNTTGTRSGVAATAITNGATGRIVGQSGYAIRLENKAGSAIDNDTLVNAGTIVGNGTVPTGTVLLQNNTADPRTLGTLDGVTYTAADAGSARFIRGDGAAIQTGEGADVLTNYGTITGNSGRAVNLEGGADTLNLYTGSVVTGRLDGGAGADTLNLRQDDRAATDRDGLGINSGARTGTLANVAGFETLNVQGGDWTLSDAQTYATGAAVAAGATLRANAALSAAMAVSGTLTGSGIVGVTTVASGGTLAFGGAAGSLNTGSLSLASGATLAGTIAAGGAPLHVAGSVALAGASLTLSLGGASGAGESFLLVDNDGSDAVTGANGAGAAFLLYDGATLAEGSTLTVQGRVYQVSYAGGDGNDVALTDVTPALPPTDTGPTPPTTPRAPRPAARARASPPQRIRPPPKMPRTKRSGRCHRCRQGGRRERGRDFPVRPPGGHEHQRLDLHADPGRHRHPYRRPHRRHANPRRPRRFRPATGHAHHRQQHRLRRALGARLAGRRRGIPGRVRRRRGPIHGSGRGRRHAPRRRGQRCRRLEGRQRPTLRRCRQRYGIRRHRGRHAVRRHGAGPRLRQPGRRPNLRQPGSGHALWRPGRRPRLRRARRRSPARQSRQRRAVREPRGRHRLREPGQRHRLRQPGGGPAVRRPGQRRALRRPRRRHAGGWARRRHPGGRARCGSLRVRRQFRPRPNPGLQPGRRRSDRAGRPDLHGQLGPERRRAAHPLGRRHGRSGRHPSRAGQRELLHSLTSSRQTAERRGLAEK